MTPLTEEEKQRESRRLKRRNLIKHARQEYQAAWLAALTGFCARHGATADSALDNADFLVELLWKREHKHE